MSTAHQSRTVPGELRHLPVDAISPDPANERDGDLGDLEGLARSIARYGVIEPVVVTATDAAGWQLVAGERRWAAAREAGLEEIPCLVHTGLPGRHRAELRLVENLCRRDLTPIQEARGYAALADRHGLSQREIADRVGRHQSHVSRRLQLLELPAEIQAEVDAGGITLEHARTLTQLVDDELADGAVDWEAARQSPTHAARELKDAQRRATRRATIVALREDDAAVIDLPEAYTVASWTLPGEDAEVASRLQERYGVAVEAHDGCRATAVDRHGRTVAVCTDTSRHELREPERQEPEEYRRARERREALDAAFERRHAFVRDELLGVGRLAADPWGALDLATLALASGGYFSDAAVCELLGLEVPTRESYGGREIEAPEAALRAHAAAGRAQAADVALAYWHVTAEVNTPHGGQSWHDHAPTVDYFDRLQEAGYELTEVEREVLAPPAQQERAEAGRDASVSGRP